MRTVYKVVCTNCGKVFETPYKGRKFCSSKCYNEHRSPKVFTCTQCGRKFTAPGKKSQKFCSISCAQKWRMEHGLKQKMLKARWDHNPYNDQKWVRKIFEEYVRYRGNIRTFAEKHGFSDTTLSKAFKKFIPAEYSMVIERKVMHAHRYAKGRHFEYRVRDFLKGKGYFILRSPRSRGPVDLVALKKGMVLLIQCKVYRRSLSRKERKELVSLAESIGAVPILAYRGTQAPKYPINFIDLRTGMIPT